MAVPVALLITKQMDRYDTECGGWENQGLSEALYIREGDTDRAGVVKVPGP